MPSEFFLLSEGDPARADTKYDLVTMDRTLNCDEIFHKFAAMISLNAALVSDLDQMPSSMSA